MASLKNFFEVSVDKEFAAQLIGRRMVYVAKLAVAMHASMELLSKRSPTVVGRQQAMIGGTDRCVTDDAQQMFAGEEMD